MKKIVAAVGWVAVIFCLGCESQAVQKTVKPVAAPIQKTTNAVFKERSIGSEDTAKAVLFPKEEEEEHKHFKLKFG